MATKNERLQELLKATSKWVETRTTELNNKTATARKILRGRTGSERLTNDTVTASSALTVDEISAFLEGI